MENGKASQRTGKWITTLGFAAIALWAQVALCAADPEIQFSAQVDRQQISQDESVSLKLTVQISGDVELKELDFQAPDFDVINEYQSTSIQSYYENGRFGMKNTRDITKVLRPKSTGTFKITAIRLQAGGKTYHSPDITVRVGAGGAGTPPPRGYGGSGVGLRGSAKAVRGPQVMVRAELDKERIFKGEQVIVSYYLYRRVKMFNIQVDKFPVLNGFLREDLEMPITGQRLDTERVVLDGVPYERSLLMRYAAYPLQEGKLKIDSVALKYNYYSNNSGAMGEDDDPFLQFFQQMAPRADRARSEEGAIQVLPLPEDGRPGGFSGGVGDFSVSSATDRYEVKANEAISLKVKVEGRGNVAAIIEPKAKWPDGLELYDTKGLAKAGPGGVGEKVFEYLLIPRVVGALTIPALEFSFFDPVKKSYIVRSTEPIKINVLPGAPGSSGSGGGSGGAAAPPVKSQQATPRAAARPEIITEWLPPHQASASKSSSWASQHIGGRPPWAWAYLIAGFLLLGAVGWVLSDFLQNRMAARSNTSASSNDWSASLRKQVQTALSIQGSEAEILECYERFENALFDRIDRTYHIGARALAREDLERILIQEKGLSPHLWDRAKKILENSEQKRFSRGGGGASNAAARSELPQWLKEAESLIQALGDVRSS